MTTGWFGSPNWFSEGHPWSWYLKFAWVPRKMDSGQWIWLKEYYHGLRIITGPGEPVVLHQYMTPQQYTWHCLTKS